MNKIVPQGDSHPLTAEQAQLLAQWNATATDYPGESRVHELFEQRVAAHPEAVAVVEGGVSVSYGELNARANRLAHRLIGLGVRAGDHVAICVERSAAAVAGFLAILKAGGAYVPLDPDYPEERLRFMLEDSAPVAVLLQADLRDRLDTGELPVLDPSAEAIQDLPDHDPVVAGLDSRSLAYVIYTSGSTGTPKGVMVEHRSIARLVIKNGYADIGADDRVAFAANTAFDAATFEIWAPLLNGGRLVVIDRATLLAPARFADALEREQVSVLWLTVGLFNQYAKPLAKQFAGLRYLITGGDALDPKVMAGVLRDGAPRNLLNGYGPTETTTFATTYRIESIASNAHSVPIGRPIGNTSTYILDEHGQPVPPGVAGELYIGGAGVARGYLNRPDLTAERFIEDRFSDEPDARLYRTGDLARYLPDGNIEYLGRNDDQVKIRGFRIELGEISARLASHEAIHEAVVLALPNSAGDRQLVAYYTLHDAQAPVTSEQLRTHLIATLPEYMIPAAYVALDILPLTPNGKIDRRALPAPDESAYARRDYAAPEGALESELATIWQDVLGCERVGRHDNFFELGGHSLLAVTLIERMRQAGISAEVRVLFSQPTIAALAAAQDEHASAAVEVPPNAIPHDAEHLDPSMLSLIELDQQEIDAIVARVPGGAANIQDIYPLAPLQEGILYHHMNGAASDPYVLTAALTIDTRERLDGFIAALREVIARHDILRTAVLWDHLREPVQVVLREAVLPIEELALSPDDGAIAAQLAARVDPRRYRLDVREAPMMRLHIARDDVQDQWQVQWVFHHLMMDHTALEQVRHEIMAILGGHREALPAPLPFRNLVAQARLGVSQAEHEAYFRERLGDLDEPTLPYGLADVQGDGNGIAEVRHALAPVLGEQLRAQARRLGVSVASLFHLAWAQVLGRLSGREDVVFGTVLFGRMQAGEGADRVLGLFINTLPVRIRLHDTSVVDSVRDTHQALAGLLHHEHASLALAQRCSGVAAPHPLFSALLNYRHSSAGAAGTGSRVEHGVAMMHEEERTNYPLTLSIDDLGNGFDLVVQADLRVEAARVAGYLDRALDALAHALDRAPATPARDLDIVPDAERDLLRGWNATDTDFPHRQCIHALFEEQARLTPDAIAVVHQDEILSYRELDMRANRLAHRLIELGVRPDDRVANCVARTPAMIVGLLAILKAGAAYLPLDPAYAGERLAYILADAEPAFVLADAAGRAALGEAALDSRTVLDPNLVPEASGLAPVVAGLHSRHLAYVIYTSGSTGQPKGVMVEHRGLVNLTRAHIARFGILPTSRMMQFASPGFDASIWEIAMTLCGGAALHLAPDNVRHDRHALWRHLERQAITHVVLPPALLQDGEDLPPLTVPATVILGGEAPSPVLLRSLASRGPLFNAYGPTECTVCATTWRCPADFDGGAVPIGAPVANTRLHLLDARGRPVPLGAVGELYIGGVGVARGYLNRPELTAERFIDDPFSDEPGARLYRTGDLARFLPDGNLVYLGRNDHQVKIRGFRIEPGEIEAQLVLHPAVREAAVLAIGEASERKLVAYVLADDADRQLAVSLRAHLSARLPDYMVPAAFVALDAFPLTPNGKLDRRALPAPDEDAFAREAYEAPRGEVEIAVAAIWGELLGAERVGRHDSFFALGGHSLLAMRLMSRVAALGAELPLASLFAQPRLADFAALLAGKLKEDQPALPAITPIERGGLLPLSFAQQRLWLLAQIENLSASYHIPIGLRLGGVLDVSAWQQALDALFARHEALRSVFASVDGEPKVRLLAADSGLPVQHHDLRGVADAEAVLARIEGEEARAPFDLAEGPLIRGRLVRLADEEHVFLLTQHHIVADGWSLAVLCRELGELYASFREGRGNTLPPLAIQYPDYAAWQREWLAGERLHRQADYWRNALAGAPVLLDLPTDRPRPERQSFEGAHVPIRIDAALTEDLRRLGERHGATLYMIVLAAWSAVLSRLSGQDEVVIGSPSASRTRQETEPLIGFFVNTLALRLDLSGEPDTAALLARARQAALAAQDHQDLPFEQVVELLNPQRSLAHTPLFQVMFAWQNNEVGEWRLPGLDVSLIAPDYDTAKFDLLLDLSEHEGGMRGTLGFASALFDRETIARHAGYLLSLLRAMAADTRQPLERVEILAPDERERLLGQWSATATPRPHESAVHELFEQQARLTPDAVAVVHEGGRLGYAELDAHANRLAHRLIEFGVHPGQRVAICVERGAATVAGILAILKAGAAYVPIDPDQPAERLAYLLDNCAPAAIVAEAATQARVAASPAPCLLLSLESGAGHAPAMPPVVARRADAAAYVIYTSGSTGIPKGVEMGHGALVNMIRWQIAQHADGAAFGARTLQLAAPSFDVSFQEIFGTLCSGGELHLVRQDLRLDLPRLARYLEAQRIERLYLPYVTLQGLAETMTRDGDAAAASCEALREVIVAGEQLRITPAIAAWFAGQTACRLHNHYGPTETHVVTAYALPADVSTWPALPPIGRPIDNTRLYLLDAHGQPVPFGVAGELYIGGACVARGYLARPELTAERFLEDPFSEEPGARLYRTGDLARFLPDGNLVYLGRNDHQVKIRGFRIEPGEIEAQLALHPAVREAAVLAIGEASERKLVAYVVATAGGEERGTSTSLAGELHAHLSARLPDYMVPAAFVALDAFPLTPNGKLDRRALPAPDENAFAREAYEAPRGEIETAVAAIWSELLGAERVGRHDSFFALGGHSLLAMRLMSRVAALGAELSLASLFAHPRMAAFAAVVARQLREEQRALPAIVPIARDGLLPSSFAQQRLWFLAQIEDVSVSYHVSLALRLAGALDMGAWQRALDVLFARHEALRSVFVSVEGELKVRLLAPDAGLPVQHHDLRGVADGEAELARIEGEEARAPFDLAEGPLIRGRLVRLADEEHVFLLTQHHIVADGWSLAVLGRELGELYASFREGRGNTLPPLAIQYPDYAAWQREWLAGERLHRQADYWRNALAGAPVLLDLPTDRPRPERQSFEGAHVPIRIDAALTDELRRLGERHGATLYMIVLAAWSAVLSRLSGQDEVVIGSPSASRTREETEPLIGFFVNTLALRLDLSGEPDTAALLARARQAALAAQDHQDLPFEQVVELLNPQRSLAHTPLFQAIFAWQNNEVADWQLPGLQVTPIDPDYDTVKFDVELNLFEQDGGITGMLGYASALFERETAGRFAGYLLSLLRAMAADTNQPLDRVDILAPAERERLLVQWNATRTDYPGESRVHELFEQRVAAHPEAVAVVEGGVSVSYGELNARANRLAHQLIGLGVRAGDHVAICVERSAAAVAGFLAILKAGGAYVPLDPDYPEERLRFMLEDSAPVAVLLQADLRDRLDTGELPVLDPSAEAIQDLPDHDPVVAGLDSRSLAYVIYTSGSTGTPKGVMVEHRSIARLVIKNGYADIGADDRVAFAANTAFDAATFEIWAPLLNGGRLVVIDRATLLAPARFADALEREQVSVLWLTVGLFNQYAKPLAKQFAGLRYLITGGDALDPKVMAGVLRDGAPRNLLNGYGPTETTTFATTYRIESIASNAHSVPIGRPIGNTSTYILDEHGQPVPPGVAGELYIGGAGVARGYLNRPDLTAERFIEDRFSDEPDARLYRTGDLARYLPDGNIEYLGRNDDQVKIRGFRIELGEIAARLASHEAIHEAVVLALPNSAGDKQLVAYYTLHAAQAPVTSEQLRTHLLTTLPEYMIPAAYVALDILPLTPNGKIDRRALPAPDESAYARRDYAAPEGALETELAAIWQDVLGCERVGRHDNFFELGGHSLLAVTLIERMRQAGMRADVRVLFSQPTVAALAHAQEERVSPEAAVPLNAIPRDARHIAPSMLGLVELDQHEIDAIVAQVPGGAANIQDIYPLAPLQEGMLYHHLAQQEGDAYLLQLRLAFDSRERLGRFVEALQAVIARHDTLRTSIAWDGLRDPVQVVWREATLPATELAIDADSGDVASQLPQRLDPRHLRLDLRQAPPMAVHYARDTRNERWVMALMFHHIALDHTGLEVMLAEVMALLDDRQAPLPPAAPFRHYVAQARQAAREGRSEAFFRTMLGDVDEPTLPYGLSEINGEADRRGVATLTSQRQLAPELSTRLRAQARRLGVSVASLFHLAWGHVVGKLAGREDVVFGTVLMGRWQGGEGVEQALGLFINTLPVRVGLGEVGVNEAVLRTHRSVADLVAHEHASLVSAQRCSGVAAPLPLFSALLNYRHSAEPDASATPGWQGIEVLDSEERTNYPCSLNVDDLGDGFRLTAQVIEPYDATRLAAYVHRGLESLVDALEQAPGTPMRDLAWLPASEQAQLRTIWNLDEASHVQEGTLHGCFEAQAALMPEVIAVEFESERLSYGELNARANRLAHRLIAAGVSKDDRV
ncbi:MULTISPECIES: non-ribosomal peptide synthetase, partial [unclassified Burkholderia]|uniref:non-ribosomal peptide synthetase n=2 Tax=Burkholderia TaxID=32008 RepID=UPI001420A40C|nr:amino acid adenylation domain-containing protein [Burkholderia sp. Tr-860]NIF98222.1 amino acid adenylation domain-containing protein [Burkholderia sp. Ax-1720]